MINFKQQDEVVPSALILLSIVLMAGTLIFLIYTQLYPPTGSAGHRSAQGRQLKNQIIQAQQRSADQLEVVRGRIWTGESDTVSAAVLGVLTKATVSRSVKLSAFRPQRSTVVGDLVELPFAVQLSGAYPSIRAVARVLDGSGSKIVLRSIQISSSGEATNDVSATLGISVYEPGDVIATAIEEADARRAALRGAASGQSPMRVRRPSQKGTGHA